MDPRKDGWSLKMDPTKEMNFQSSESSCAVNDDEITSEVKFERILDKFMAKTRPRPKVINGNPLWKRILSEHAETAWYAMKQEDSFLPHGIDTKEWKYLKKEIFPTLLPAIEETMNLAQRLKVQEGKFRAFNYLDTLIHYMLNLNLKPGEPIKMVEDFEEIKKHLEKFPKPSIPKHKVWSRHKAATLIQKNVRGWLVRKRPEVFEMRQFWKAIRKELKSRIGTVIPRPIMPSLSEILPSDPDISSETDATIYLDEKKYWKATEEGSRDDRLTLLSLAQKPQGKSHTKHFKSAAREHNFREAMIQTERIVYRTEIDCEKKNPFYQNRSGFGNASARRSHFSKNKPKDKPRKTKLHKRKPEISKQEIEVSMSFEDLKDKNNMK